MFVSLSAIFSHTIRRWATKLGTQVDLRPIKNLILFYDVIFVPMNELTMGEHYLFFGFIHLHENILSIKFHDSFSFTATKCELYIIYIKMIMLLINQAKQLLLFCNYWATFLSVIECSKSWKSSEIKSTTWDTNCIPDINPYNHEPTDKPI